ncbi:MAG: MFS transporter [Clostridium sp.]|uniref:MFS transporter n=1 Tax=Clostridium sp. TaxID=1506 RepID=UPI003062E441
MIKTKNFEVIRNFPRNVHIMVFSEGVFAIATGIFFFLQILYYNFIELSPSTIGVIFFIGSLFGLIGFFIGPFIRIIGRKNLLCLGLIIFAVGILFHMIFSTLILIVVGEILVSIGISLIQVTEIQLIYSYAIGQNECCVYSYKCAVNFICGAIGAVIAGNISKIYIFKNVGYGKLFFVAIILIVIAGAIRYWLLPKDYKCEVDGKQIKKSIKNSIVFLREDKKVQVFSALLFITTIGFSAVGPYNNLILKESFNLGNNIISYITFTLTSLSMIGIVLMPVIIEKIGVSAFNIIIFVIPTVSCFVLSLGLSTKIFIVVLIIRCIFAWIIVSSLDSLMMSNIQSEDRDIFAAVKMLVNGVSVALGNLIGGWILNKYGYRGNYLYGAIILVFGVLFFYIKSRGFMVNAVEKKSCNCSFKSRHIEYRRH